MQLRPFWRLWACLCILWVGGAAAQSLSPMRNEGYTPSAVKGFRLTVGNPYERRMRFVLVPMNPQFTRAVSGVRINPPEMVLAPGHARQAILAFKIAPARKERTIGLCILPKHIEGPVLPRVCGTYTGARLPGTGG